ncbi:hypothetical protein NIES4073_60270 [Kalymmatonema gypsitolerans NIES-4073]|nr:hypothetical protein NIES4073_60270 [Scytonema sp. NIES-4073]
MTEAGHLIMNIQQLRHSLKLKWVSYYSNNRSWLIKMRVWGSYDGQRRPSSGFILATVSVLEPELEEIFPFILELNNDPDQIIAALGLNFNPEEHLDLVESAHSLVENEVKNESWHETLPKYQALTPSVVDTEVENNGKPVPFAYFSPDLENLSPNLSPPLPNPPLKGEGRGAAFILRQTLNSPHSLLGKGVGGLGLTLFPHGVKSQVSSVALTSEVPPQTQTESQPSTFSQIVSEVENNGKSVESVAAVSTHVESKSNSVGSITTTTIKPENKSQSMPLAAFFCNKMESKSQSVASVSHATRLDRKNKPRSLLAVDTSDGESKSQPMSLAAFIARKVDSKPVSSVPFATQVERKGRLVTTPQKNAHNQVNPPPASTSHLANWIDDFCQGVGCDQEETPFIR